MTGARTGHKFLIIVLTAILILIAGGIAFGVYADYIVPVKEKLFPARTVSPACRQCMDNCSRLLLKPHVCISLCTGNQSCSGP